MMKNDPCECCVCRDCLWYYDFFCECLESPSCFVTPELPAASCKYYRPVPFPSSAGSDSAAPSDRAEIA